MNDNAESHTGDTRATDGKRAFISYAGADAKRAEEVCTSLESRDLSCWMAPRDVPPGAEYGEAVARAIRECGSLVLLLSSAANDSPMVRREVELALGAGKPVFPVRIEDVLPARGLEIYVSSTHWINAWEGEFDTHLATLAGVLADDRALYEQAETIRSRRRRKAVRERVSWTSVAVVLIAIAALLIAIVRQRSGAGGLSDQAREIAKRYGVQVDKVSADDFGVNFLMWNAGEWSDGLPMLRVDMPGGLESLVPYQMIQIRVGDLPWQILYEDHEGYVSAMITNAELEADGPVSFRIVAEDNEESRPSYGPFTVDFSIREAIEQVVDRREEQYRKAIDEAEWARADYGMWRFTDELAGQPMHIVRAIHVGASEQRLDTTWTIPRAKSWLEDPFGGVESVARVGEPVSIDMMSEAINVLQPFTKAPELFAQIEYLDGSRSEVRRFESDYRAPGSTR